MTAMSHDSLPVDAPRRRRTPEQTRADRRRRMPFLIFGLAFFACAIYGGLWRLGFDLPHGAAVAGLHGPLMICGFFGTLIGLERAVALGKGILFTSPALSIAGSLAAAAGAPERIVAALYLGAGVILAAASFSVLRVERHLFTLVLALGASAFAVGNAVWLAGGAIPDAVAWWLLFLVLTIAAERLEMSRLLGIGRTEQATFALIVLALLIGAAPGLFSPWGASLTGLGFLFLALWLVRHDIALRNIRRAPHLRFFGICMAAGYGWMALAGASLLLASPAAAAYGYDLVLHAVLIGFVLSMALGHSIIVIPALTGAAAPYHGSMYIGLALLHGSIALRVVSDLLEWQPGRMASGPLTLLGLIAFLVVLVRQIRAASRLRRAS